MESGRGNQGRTGATLEEEAKGAEAVDESEAKSEGEITGSGHRNLDSSRAIEEESARGLFDALRGSDAEVSLSDFLQWEDLLDLLHHGALQSSDLEKCIEQVCTDESGNSITHLSLGVLFDLLCLIHDCTDQGKLEEEAEAEDDREVHEGVCVVGERVEPNGAPSPSHVNNNSEDEYSEYSEDNDNNDNNDIAEVDPVQYNNNSNNSNHSNHNNNNDLLQQLTTVLRAIRPTIEPQVDGGCTVEQALGQAVGQTVGQTVGQAVIEPYTNSHRSHPLDDWLSPPQGLLSPSFHQGMLVHSILPCLVIFKTSTFNLGGFTYHIL